MTRLMAQVKSGRFGCLLLVLTVQAGVAAAAEEPGPPPPGLAFVAAGKEYRFDTGDLAGVLRSGGRSVGLMPVTDKATGARVPKSVGLFSHYRLLSSDDRFGPAAWDWPSVARRLDDGAVEARWTTDEGHPFDMAAVYRWREPGVLDLTTTVTARRGLRHFEVFLASYFEGFAAARVYVKGGGEGGEPGFVAVDRASGVWQMFPRDDAAGRIIRDGRWQRPPNPVDWVLRDHLAAPLALRRDEKTGLTAVVMAPAGDCFAVASPHGEEPHRSLYLSLFGRDLAAGETAVAHARLLLGRGISDERAVALYQAYRKDLAAAGRSGPGRLR